MPLSGPFDHWAESSPVHTLAGPFDHSADGLPTRSLSGPFDHDGDQIPLRSLAGPFDHDADQKLPNVSGPFDHFADEADVLPLVPSGARARNPGLGLVVVNVSPDAVELGWNSITVADLADDDLVTDVVTKLTAAAGQFPPDILAGGRSVLGYKLHRGDPGFVPEGISAGQGNCIVDEVTLGPGSSGHVDSTVLSNTLYAYRLALVIGQP